MKKYFAYLFLCAFLCSINLCSEVYASPTDANVSAISLSMKYKDISYKIRVINKMKAQAKKLSDEEKGVIQKYIYGAVKGEDTFLLINCNLRNTLEYYIPKKEVTKPLKCRLDFYADSLAQPILKTELPQNMILYRGVDEKGMSLIFVDKNIKDVLYKPVNEENLAILRQKLVGTKFEDKGFMSTSYNKNCAKQTKFMFEVCAPKKLKAILLEDLGKRAEKEVLINKDTKWEITEITKEYNKNTKQDCYKLRIKYSLK